MIEPVMAVIRLKRLHSPGDWACFGSNSSGGGWAREAIEPVLAVIRLERAGLAKR